MSSAFRAPSQIAPFKAYIAEAAGQLYNDAGVALSFAVAADTVLLDMGKTVRRASDGAILRKVQEQRSGGGGYTGYMFLTNAPAGQNLYALN